MNEPLAAEAPASYGALFRVDRFFSLVAGMILGRIAAQMVELVLVLFVLEEHGSPALAGLTTFAALMPGLLASPIAGALLDRYGRRRLIVFDYFVAAVGYAAIAGLSLIGALPIPLFLLMVVATSLTFPLSTAGLRSLFPLVVPRALWERANAIDSNGYAVASIFAPAAAGALVAAIHGEGALLITAGVFLVAAVVTTRTPDPSTRLTSGPPLLRAAWDGLAHVARHQTLRGLALGVSVGNVGHGIFFISIPVIVLQHLGGTSVLVGQVFAAMGLASFVSILLFGRMRTEGRERDLMLGSALMIAAATAILLFRIDLLTIVVAAVLIGLATGPYDIALFTVRQRRTDPAWLGRAFAVSMAANFVGFPLGSALGGVLTSVSMQLAILTSAAFCALAAALIFALVPKRAP